jgi:hypothetical protein
MNNLHRLVVESETRTVFTSNCLLIDRSLTFKDVELAVIRSDLITAYKNKQSGCEHRNEKTDIHSSIKNLTISQI